MSASLMTLASHAQDARGRAQVAWSHSERAPAAIDWQNIKKTLQACPAADDTVNVSVVLQIVLQAERVPTIGSTVRLTGHLQLTLV
jgi:hypothetical protein